MQHFFDSNFHIQLIGFIAIAFSFAVFQTNKRPRMLILQTCAALLWVAHFGLLGAWTGSMMNLITALRNLVFYKAGKKRSVMIPLSLAGLFVLATALTWDGARSLFPLGGSLIGTLAFWQIKTHHIRLIVIFGPCLWLVYNLYVGSYAGLTADAVTISSILIGMYRFDIRPMLRRSLRPALQKRR